MSEMGVTEQLAFVLAQRNQDEATVLAEAMREGVQILYRETLSQAYILGQVPREMVLQQLGPEQLADLEYQRDVLLRDVAWGSSSG